MLDLALSGPRGMLDMGGGGGGSIRMPEHSFITRQLINIDCNCTKMPSLPGIYLGLVKLVVFLSFKVG